MGGSVELWSRFFRRSSPVDRVAVADVEEAWETCGNPDGIPALVVHGGPGSGCQPSARRWFDPSEYRVVLVDQRNCGRSRPHASDPAVDLGSNTTSNLIADFEKVRNHLGINRWLIRGWSWGLNPGPGLRRAAPRTRLRVGAVRGDHHATVRDRLVVPRRRPVLPRGMGPIP
jgi:pimeloyl-ACP methyl ester carboxylesterase